MTFEETAAALLAAEAKRKDDARKAREAAKRKASKPESKASKDARHASLRQAFRAWMAPTVEDFDRRFLANMDTYRAPASAIHPVKR